MERGLVIGKGAIGDRHFQALRRFLPNQKHSHISSRMFDAEIASAKHKELHHKLFSAFDFAIIASPASRHIPQLVQISQAGLPALVEKPLSAEVEEAQSFLTQFGHYKQEIQVGYVLRHSPAFRYLKSQLEISPVRPIRIIVRVETFFPEWRPRTDYKETVTAQSALGGGVLRELSHEFDYALDLFGPIRIDSARITPSGLPGLDVETACEVIGKSASGLPIVFEMNLLSNRQERWCRVEFTGGGNLTWDLLDQSVVYRSSEDSVTQRKFLKPRDSMYDAQLEHFLGVVRGTKYPLPDIEAAMKVMELIGEVEENSVELQ